MKICVLGLGYIGLPTALLLAKSGHEVIGVDKDPDVIDSLENDTPHFEEPGLQDLFDEVKNNFRPSEEMEESEVYLIAVPTPLEESIKVSDMSYIEQAALDIKDYLKKDDLVIVESTIPPGTSENLIAPKLENNGLQLGDFYLAHSPERAIPGDTINEMINNDRIIGGYDERSRELAKEMYSGFVEGEIYLTGLKTAELVKLMENTFRDVNIALANEFARIGKENGVDIWETIELANKHPRVDILKPGPGVGGHCISVDPWFLNETTTSSKMVNLAREINDSMPNFVMKMVNDMLEDIRSPTITLFGVAYKGNVDDTRESPAYKIIKLAQNQGMDVKCYDPYVDDFEYELYPLEEAVKGSDCIVVVTDHDDFKDIDPEKIEMGNKKVLDTRNILDETDWEQKGFEIRILGRGIS